MWIVAAIAGAVVLVALTVALLAETKCGSGMPEPGDVDCVPPYAAT